MLATNQYDIANNISDAYDEKKRAHQIFILKKKVLVQRLKYFLHLIINKRNEF